MSVPPSQPSPNASRTSIRELTSRLRSFRSDTQTRGVTTLLAAPDSEANDNHLACLKSSLQAAVTLEFATLPPYLCALWSIKNERDPVAVSIREVAHEEMLHMALAANMLAAIGGSPRIHDEVPSYPGPLPGGVHPHLIAKLSCLTPEALRDFLWIERPVREVPHDHPFGEPSAHWDNESGFEGDETIGEFYESIKASFLQLKPVLRPDHQIAGPLAWSVITRLEDVERAIELIQHQGEGSATSPMVGRSELSHFYRFLEVYEGRRMVWDPVSKKLTHGDPLPFPEVWPMAVVPPGGYKPSEVSPEVARLLEESDLAYSRMLDLLQDSWRRGGQASFVHAIEAMFELQRTAKALMQIEIPGKSGATYGPCFRYIPRRS